MPQIIREAKLKHEFADRYPGIEPEVWAPAAQLAEWVRSRLPARDRSGDDPRRRPLHPVHFVFRTCIIGSVLTSPDAPPPTRSLTADYSPTDIRVRGELAPIAQQARVTRDAAQLPDWASRDRWYDVFAGPFTLAHVQVEEVLLIADGRLRGLPRRWLEFREIEPRPHGAELAER